MNCVIYTRFSPRPDAATSDSCETQERQCREWCERKGLAVKTVIRDADVSGKDEYRPKLWAAIAELKKGDVLVCYKRDRLARSVYLAEYLNRAVETRGATIAAVAGDFEGDTPEIVMARQIVAVVAEYERKLIAARTSAALRAKQSAGRRVSNLPPFGWSVDPSDPKRLVRNESEQVTIKEIMNLRAQGLAYNKIAAKLDPKRARSGRWHGEIVRRIVSYQKR